MYVEKRLMSLIEIGRPSRVASLNVTATGLPICGIESVLAVVTFTIVMNMPGSSVAALNPATPGVLLIGASGSGGGGLLSPFVLLSLVLFVLLSFVVLVLLSLVVFVLLSFVVLVLLSLF